MDNTPLDDQDIKRSFAAMESVLETLKRSQHRGGSYMPYYKEIYAIEVKEILDRIAKTGEPMMIPITNTAFATLRNKFNQALRFLLANLDPDGYYRDLRTKLKVSENRSRGIIISPRKERGLLKGYDIADWKPDFFQFIQEAEVKDKFCRLGLPLTVEDLQWLHEQLQPIKDKFVTDISLDGIIIIRV